MNIMPVYGYHRVIEEICHLKWSELSVEQMMLAAWAYYYFSIQFRENLQIARDLFPSDDKLRHLESEECDTDNLSPWPGVAQSGEKLNHDEFMRRALELTPIDDEMRAHVSAVGQVYLARVRRLDPVCRAASIASYEDGGLESVFKAMLGFRAWENSLLQAFEHFLAEHIRFDSDPEQGHGALSRHMAADDRIMPLWEDFRMLLVTCVPALRPDAVWPQDPQASTERDMTQGDDQLALVPR